MSTETYADVYSFLKLHTEVAELVDPEGTGRVLVTPDLAGRVMTSTPAGVQGPSCGWVNRDAFIKPRDPVFTNFGAEERLWLGPEGGQFSLYFPPDAPFEMANWIVPKAFNEDPYAVFEQTETRVAMVSQLALSNWSGTAFNLTCERAVNLLARSAIEKQLSVKLPAKVTAVGYETVNAVSNRGAEPLAKETGLISIWLLCMLNASPKTAVLIPYLTDADGGTGPIVKDDYFGSIPKDRLVVTDTCVVFKGDAQHRGKIGFSPTRTKDRLGSLDLSSNLLTVVTFSFAGDPDYVNSAWEKQDEPYRGDVVNSYNDGPPPGAERGFGNFYELESSSPAKLLDPGEKVEHRQQTFHFQGTAAAMNKLAGKLLGAGAKEAKLVLGK